MDTSFSFFVHQKKNLRLDQDQSDSTEFNNIVTWLELIWNIEIKREGFVAGKSVMSVFLWKYFFDFHELTFSSCIVVMVWRSIKERNIYLVQGCQQMKPLE